METAHSPWLYTPPVSCGEMLRMSEQVLRAGGGKGRVLRELMGGTRLSPGWGCFLQEGREEWGLACWGGVGRGRAGGEETDDR